VRIFGVSVDEPSESQAFARAYGIAFPLLTDAGGAVSRAYVGLDATDVSVPGIVVIRKTGEIVYRQIATSKNHRLAAADVIAIVDRTLDPGTDRPPAHTGYAALERSQLRVEGAAGAIRVDDEWRATGFGGLTILHPPVRYLLVGAGLRFEAREQILVGDASVGLRIPVLEVGAVHVVATAGLPLQNADGVYLGGRAGVWFALRPAWAVHLDVGGGAFDASGDRVPEVFATFGVARLFDVTGPW
jgi:hypothetical protein